jgi:hypothetical protein
VARTDDAPLPTPPPSDVVESIADAMFALSSTSRVNILMLLRERPCTVGGIVRAARRGE